MTKSAILPTALGVFLCMIIIYSCSDQPSHFEILKNNTWCITEVVNNGANVQPEENTSIIVIDECYQIFGLLENGLTDFPAYGDKCRVGRWTKLSEDSFRIDAEGPNKANCKSLFIGDFSIVGDIDKLVLKNDSTQITCLKI